MSNSISKQRHNDNPNSFERLYQLGLTYIQQLSGHIWTDYNTHDPGMTILEQLCYALTDLIYRCEFDVTDYLSDASGNIDYRAHGLAYAQDILPAYPQQLEEYETWLLTRLPQFDKVWLRTTPAMTHFGIYTINAQLNHFYALSQSRSSQTVNENTQQQQAIQKLYQEFHQIRGLNEDLAEISLTGQSPLTLNATVYISDDITNPTQLAAELYHQINIGLETNTQPTPVEVIKETLLSTLGILKIEAFEFTQRNPSHTDNAVVIDTIPPFSYVTLPESTANLGIDMIQHQHVVDIDYSDLIIQIEQLQHQRRTTQLHIETPPAIPKGRYFNFSGYESIQTLFPRNYHLAPGTPNRYSAQQQGQRHQLRSYLLLFDQLMANFCDDIAGLNNLFSVSLEQQKTYHHHMLQEHEFYNINQHYPSNASERLEKLRHQFDHYPERKNRLFDYLIALYGEHFPDALHRQFNPYLSTQNLETQLLIYKQAFILNIATITNARGIGDNLFEPQHQGGYHQRLMLLLGLSAKADGSLSYTRSITKHLLNVVQTDSYCQSTIGKKVVFIFRPDTYNRLEVLDDNLLNDEVSEQQARQIRAAVTLFNAQTLPEELLQFGIDNHRYRILHRIERGDYQLFFQLKHHQTDQWIYIARHNNKQKLTRFCHLLQRWLIELNQTTEGLYVVEPMLLRPTDNDVDLERYANRLLIVFPGYTARFNQPNFREQVEQLVTDNSPAHLLAQCQWLDFYAFAKFETLYHQWRDAKSLALKEGNLDSECATIAQQLYQFLQTPSNEYPEELVI